jgi:hypothetical protein
MINNDSFSKLFVFKICGLNPVAHCFAGHADRFGYAV